MIVATLEAGGTGDRIDNGAVGGLDGDSAHRVVKHLLPTQAAITGAEQSAVAVACQISGFRVTRVDGQDGAKRAARHITAGIGLGPGDPAVGAAIDAGEARRPDDTRVGRGNLEVEHLRTRTTDHAKMKSMPGAPAVRAARQAAIGKANKQEAATIAGTDEADVPGAGNGCLGRHGGKIGRSRGRRIRGLCQTCRKARGDQGYE